MTDGRPQFQVEIVQRSSEGALITLTGEIDLYTAPQLDEALAAVIAAGPCTSSLISRL